MKVTSLPALTEPQKLAQDWPGHGNFAVRAAKSQIVNYVIAQ